MTTGASLTGSVSVRKLQTVLHAKAKEEPGRRFHALADKVWREDFLLAAWGMVRRNGGAAGTDGETVADVEAHGVERWVGELSRDLRGGTYTPSPVRQVLIPKKQPGKFRVTTRDEDGLDRPTVAGLLAFSADPARLLPSAYIEAACYGDTRLSSDDLVHAERLAGPVADQIDAGIAFVMHYMRHGRPAGAEDAYDIDVVDEAIVNAVAHRGYSVSGPKIRLFLYTDRLEVYSPGKLPNGLAIEEMPYRTFTRNQLLVSFLSKMRSKRTGRVFLELREEGVRRILEAGEAHSGRRPVYELFGEELRLTVWGRGTSQSDYTVLIGVPAGFRQALARPNEHMSEKGGSGNEQE